MEIETRLLRALCNGAVPSHQLDEVHRLLENYSWRSRDHQIVFEVLAKLRDVSPEDIRANLAAELTRKGFPDVAIEDYFRIERGEPVNCLRMIQSLLAARCGVA